MKKIKQKGYSKFYQLVYRKNFTAKEMIADYNIHNYMSSHILIICIEKWIRN